MRSFSVFLICLIRMDRPFSVAYRNKVRFGMKIATVLIETCDKRAQLFVRFARLLHGIS